MGMVQEANAPLHKRIFHSWIAPLIRAGRQRPLTLDDLDPVPPIEDSLEETSRLFRQAFTGRILPALFQTFRVRLIKIFNLLFLMAILGMLRPLLLRELIGRYSQRSGTPFIRFFSFIDSELSMAFFAIGSFALLAWLRSHFLRYSFKLTWSMPGLLRHEVYRKLLALSPRQKARLTTGEYVNIATRDCDSTSMIAFLLETLLYPLMVLVYCAMLVYLLGPWALLAILLLAGIIPIGRRLERKMSALADEIREQARLRLGILSEILSGIRVIKFHAWEESFEKRVLAIREKEINLMRKRARIAAGHSAISSLLPILTGAIIVSLVSWISRVPSTADVFAAFSVITSLVAIFSETPDLLQNISELRVSLNRIRDFLALPVENQESTGEKSQTLEMISASYSRSASANYSAASAVSRALTDISLSVPAGRRVCIVGGVGAGKSTLLSAILGELQLNSGSHSLPKPIAFAPQIPWNQNASVRDNVVFELNWNKDLFDQVIFAAALEADLQQWPGGADSEVGERGINLSGG
ncbi:ATP-binding cassette domain-containing protein, partial [bacterium]|nr:ATP-binding cassette domain-containing protein [bacterium]